MSFGDAIVRRRQQLVIAYLRAVIQDPYNIQISPYVLPWTEDALVFGPKSTGMVHATPIGMIVMCFDDVLMGSFRNAQMVKLTDTKVYVSSLTPQSNSLHHDVGEKIEWHSDCGLLLGSGCDVYHQLRDSMETQLGIPNDVLRSLCDLTGDKAKYGFSHYDGVDIYRQAIKILETLFSANKAMAKGGTFKDIRL